MKVCACGGVWHRHGKAQGKIRRGGVLYKCASCGKSITVRGGKIATNTGPRISDWRTHDTHNV